MKCDRVVIVIFLTCVLLKRLRVCVIVHFSARNMYVAAVVVVPREMPEYLGFFCADVQRSLAADKNICSVLLAMCLFVVLEIFTVRSAPIILYIHSNCHRCRRSNQNELKV